MAGQGEQEGEKPQIQLVRQEKEQIGQSLESTTGRIMRGEMGHQRINTTYFITRFQFEVG